MNRQLTAMRAKGFTLIEMMITVAVIGILAAIAYPSYTAYIVKANRAAAQAHLMDIAQRQQQYFLDNRRYASTVGALSISTPDKVAAVYTITIDADNSAAPPSFVVTADGKTGTVQASEADLTINNAGVKTPAGKW